MQDHIENRYVAHFDMLGMRTLTKRNPDLAWEKLSHMAYARDKRLSSLAIQRFDTNEMIADQVRTFTFSDTVIAFSKGNSENDVLAIVLLATELFTYSLHLGIPLRGGITHGRFAFNFDLSLFSGPALVDAYELGEASQWLGIILDQHTANAFLSLPVGKVTGSKPVIVEWDVKCKNGAVCRRNVVNWPASHRHSYIGPIPLTVESFYEPFRPLFGPYKELRSEDASKYQNTVDFFTSHFVP